MILKKIFVYLKHVIKSNIIMTYEGKSSAYATSVSH